MNDDEIDLIAIDNKIKDSFKSKKAELPNLKIRLKNLESLNIENIPRRIRSDITSSISSLKKQISTIEEGIEETFYIVKSSEILEEYKKILSIPITISFSNNKKKTNKEKEALINKYLELAESYIHIKRKEKKDKRKKITCPECHNKDEFEQPDETTIICINCGVQQDIGNKISYKDVDRVNISTKYSYDRKVHFRDCINQYQGKQNATIDNKVYKNLEEEFERHHLLIGDKNTSRDQRFSKITKEHISIFLKELKLTKHYENINLIYFNMTGNKPDDISHLEEQLLHDFDLLTEVYDKKFRSKIERTNFINTQYVLYQLLQKYKHPCRKEDFILLKTIERQNFHDEITRECFEELGWNHASLF